jgi:tRNA1Val (adenine37-N6)-methyltransferase
MAGGFTFKRFAIEQQRSAMKVGTDGVLLGAWANINPSQKRFLDIGAGTGLIALMVAQRSEEWGGSVVGVEIDPQSFMDARENVASSPWRERVTIENCAIQEFAPDVTFDHILSNPPYFVAGPASQTHQTARREDTCPLDTLLSSAAWALKYGGDFYLVHRPERLAEICATASNHHLEPKRLCLLRHRENGPVTLVLLQCKKGGKPGLIWDEWTLFDAQGTPTQRYKTLYHLQEA